MSKFQAFLKGNSKRIKAKNVIISDAFLDENGKIVPFTIRTLPTNLVSKWQNEFSSLNENGEAEFDTAGYNKKIMIEAVVFPDLKNQELQDSYGVIGEGALLDEMLLYGEQTKLIQEINVLNGFKTIDEKVKEIKN